MIQTINPYGSARTAEIMSRYRPIAPKPESSSITENNNFQNGSENENSNMPQSIRKSAYLRDVWAHLQARPTRTRKRGRSAAFPPPCLKRPKNGPFQPPAAVHGFSFVPFNYAAADEEKNRGIDLNVKVEELGPKEFDFMPQLKQPVKPSVITPQPVRPIGSSIVVKSVVGGGSRVEADAPMRRAEEVEREIEGDAVPSVISDWKNKVRVANSAYKEMVGQPECCWLERVAACGGACRRIGGEVSLRFCGDSELRIMSMDDGFTSEVKIVWEIEGEERCVDGFCDVVKLGFEENNCRFLWRFRTREAPKCGLGDV